MYKHFTAANEYFVESKASMEYEPGLVQALDAIFVGVIEVQRQVRDRAKLGSIAATSVPISLTGKKPKRSDILGRWSGLPKRDARLIPLPQPIFDHTAEDPSLPDYIFQRRAATSTVTTEASSIEGQPGPSAPATTTAGQATPTAPVTTTAGQATPTAPVTTTAGQATPTAPLTSTLTSGATTSSSSDTTSGRKNSPVMGLGALSKQSNIKMSRERPIHQPTHKTIYPPIGGGVYTYFKSSNRIEIS